MAIKQFPHISIGPASIVNFWDEEDDVKKVVMFTRHYTDGQARSMKRMIGLLYKLKAVSVKSITFTRMDMSSPGMPDTYRVRITYR